MSRPVVLFVCTHNRARSQLCEGLLNARHGARYSALSAGTEPGTVHPLAVTVLAEVGIDISAHRSKSIDEVALEPPDVVVTVCDDASVPSGEFACHRGCRGAC